AVLQHRHPIYPESERKSGISLAVVADLTEDLGVDHPGAADLEPAGALAHPADIARRQGPLPLAGGAGDVHLRRRLGEGEERRPETDAGPLAEEALHEVEERAL